MRILFLSNFYPPYSQGGYEENCKDIADGLQARGHIVHIATTTHGIWKPSISGNIHHILFPEVDARPFRGTLGYFINRNKRKRLSLSAFKHLTSEISPDIIFIWGMWNMHRELSLIAENNQQVKTAYYLSDYWPTLPNAYTLHWQEPPRKSLSTFPKKILRRFALKQLEKESLPVLKFENAICVSNFVKEFLIDADLPFENSQVINNGININLFSEVEYTDKQVKTFSIVYAGRLTHEKGVHTIIQAVSILINQGKEVSLHVYGTGKSDYMNWLHQLCAEMGVEPYVIFYGKIPRSHLPSKLKEHSVFITPSIWPEPLPLSTQEAMALEIPVIGAKVGGIPELINDGMNGLLFQAENSNQLANKIRLLMDNPNLCNDLSKAGLETIKKHFNTTRMLDEIEDYLQNLVLTIK